MNSKASNFAALALFLLLSSSASAFNITKILSGYSDFSTFNNYLNQTKLSDQINSRQTITILAVSNGALGFLSGRSSDIVKKILSVHVILDYYDEQKLSKLSKDNETTLTTLYQSTGNAVNQQGFIKVSVDKSSKQVTLTSAARGASGGVKVVKSVTSQPYNISVIQVDNIIPVPGLDSNSPQTPPPSPPKQSPAPSPSNKKSDNSMAPSPSESGDAPSPSEDKDAPSLSPEADAPELASADAPKADAPEPASADSPTESEPPTDSSGVSGSGVIGFGVLMGLIMSFFVAF